MLGFMSVYLGRYVHHKQSAKKNSCSKSFRESLQNVKIFFLERTLNAAIKNLTQRKGLLPTPISLEIHYVKSHFYLHSSSYYNVYDH